MILHEVIKNYFPGVRTHTYPANTNFGSDDASGIEQSFNLFQIIISSPEDDWK